MQVSIRVVWLVTIRLLAAMNARTERNGFMRMCTYVGHYNIEAHKTHSEYQSDLFLNIANKALI